VVGGGWRVEPHGNPWVPGLVPASPAHCPARCSMLAQLLACHDPPACLHSTLTFQQEHARVDFSSERNTSSSAAYLPVEVGWAGFRCGAMELGSVAGQQLSNRTC